MGLRVSIIGDRNSKYGDSSNGGVSSKVDELTIINIGGPFEATENAPAAMLVMGNIPNSVKIIPSAGYATERRAGPMMGGCYVTTSDSRFSDKLESMGMPRGMAVPLHDRWETWEQYRSLSI